MSSNTPPPAGLTQFGYLLNAMEAAGQADRPADHGYGEKRRALLAYVRDLERRALPAAPLPDAGETLNLWAVAQRIADQTHSAKECRGGDEHDCGLFHFAKRALHEAVDAALAAPPPDAGLVALVREWQEARKPATLSAPGEFLAETFQAAVRRMSTADEALAGYDLPHHEKGEAMICAICGKSLTNVVRAWDDAPLCESCAEPSVPASAVEGITVAGARAFWRWKDEAAAHERLRAAVMTIYSDPHLTWEQARIALAQALTTDHNESDAADTLRAERAQRNGDDTGWLVETKQGDTFTDVDVYDDGDVIVSTGGKNVPPRSVRVSELWAERDRLKEALRELVATVRGECPSILNEDSGGNAALDLRIDALLTPTPTPEKPASTKERSMKASVAYKEVRFVIEDWRTRVFVLCEASGDTPLGVQGWHAKDFPPSTPVADIVPHVFGGTDDPVLWPQETPRG